MTYKFVVNRNRKDIDADKFTEFKALKEMREFIDEDECCPMEVTVYKNDEQVISLPASIYWQGHGRHPTLKELIGN